MSLDRGLIKDEESNEFPAFFDFTVHSAVTLFRLQKPGCVIFFSQVLITTKKTTLLASLLYSVTPTVYPPSFLQPPPSSYTYKILYFESSLILLIPSFDSSFHLFPSLLFGYSSRFLLTARLQFFASLSTLLFSLIRTLFSLTCHSSYFFHPKLSTSLIFLLFSLLNSPS